MKKVEEFIEPAAGVPINIMKKVEKSERQLVHLPGFVHQNRLSHEITTWSQIHDFMKQSDQ